MAYKKKKKIEKKEALRRERIGDYAFFGGQRDHPGQKTVGRVALATKPLGSAHFYYPLNLGGVCVCVCLPGEGTEGTRKPSLPMAPGQVIFHC